jgi:hypothetical protein
VGFIIAVVFAAMAVASVLGGNWLAAALGAAGAVTFLFLSLRDRTARSHRSEQR